MTSPILKAVFKTILDEIENNPSFADRIKNALRQTDLPDQKGKRARRAPAVLDPIKVFEESGDEGLRHAMSALTLDQLKDIVAEYGMDSAKLVMKWAKPERVIDHILMTTATRTRKGDAFR